MMIQMNIQDYLQNGKLDFTIATPEGISAFIVL